MFDPDADRDCDHCHGDGRCRDCGYQVLCDDCGENLRHCSTCECTGMCPECVRPKYRGTA